MALLVREEDEKENWVLDNGSKAVLILHMVQIDNGFISWSFKDGEHKRG